jgi:hypothetical protein
VVQEQQVKVMLVVLVVGHHVLQQVVAVVQVK